MLAFFIFSSMEFILIPFFIVYVVDFALIPEHLKRKWYYRKYHSSVPYKPFSAKPFDCSGCLTFWMSLTYLIIGGTITSEALGGYVLLSTFNGIIALLLRKWIN
jgi:hypothetical protein